jgi:hypothetical protein
VAFPGEAITHGPCAHNGKETPPWRRRTPPRGGASRLAWDTLEPGVVGTLPLWDGEG